MKTKGIVLGVALLVSALFVLGVLVKDGRSLGRKDTPVVTTVKVETGAAVSHVMAEGTVVPAQVTNVTVLPSFRAQVARVYVNNGDRVVKGQVLAELDAVEVTDDVDRAAAAVEGARARYALTRSPHRPEEIQQALENVRAAQARYALVLHPHRPEW